MEAFNADVQLLPLWVQYWMNFLGVVLLLSTLAFLLRKDTRLLGLYLLVTTVASMGIMLWMHSQMGMVRLLGIVHVVFWTPLIIYLIKRLRHNPPSKLYVVVMAALMISCTAALVFDYYDVLRWLAGERAPVVSASGA